ncbi:MAG: hypothetical protein ACRDPG_06320 [Nocardioidaceae bacterium]
MSGRQTKVRAAIIAAACGFLMLLSLAAPAGATTTATPTATQIALTNVSTPGLTVPPTGSAPSLTGPTPEAIVLAGSLFSVTITLEDQSGTPAPYGKPITVSLSATGDKLSSTDGLSARIPKGATSVVFNNLTLSQSIDGVVLTASDVKDGFRANVLLAVQSEAQNAPASSNLTSVGAGGGVGLSCSPTPTDQVCGDLVLPNGSDGQQLMTLGVCSGTDCPTNNTYLWAMAGVSGYSNSSPATLILKCDKTLCTGGGINTYHPLVSLVPNGPLTQAPPCPSKGTVGAGQQVCVDYVQSRRDNAGDTLLYILFVNDPRVSFP